LFELFTSYLVTNFWINIPLSFEACTLRSGLNTISLTPSRNRVVSPLLQIKEVEQVYELLPLVNHLFLGGMSSRDSELVCSSAFWKVISNASLGFCSTSSFLNFCKYANLNEIQSFTISGNLGDCIGEILDNQSLGKLQSLNLGFNSLSTGFATKFHTARPLPRLQKLRLGGNRFSKSDFKLLATSPMMENIQDIEFMSYMDYSGWAADFFTSLGSSVLENVVLGGNPLSVDDFQSIANSASVARVQHWDFSHTKMRTDGLRKLVESRYFQEVRTINLSSNMLDKDASSLFEKGLPWPQLKKLDLSRNLFDQSLVDRLRNHSAYTSVKIVG
jgi:hypothetical protein